jgi:hypothetical protein
MEVLTMAGRKEEVLIVSVLLPIIIDLALRSKTQRRIEVLRGVSSPFSCTWLLEPKRSSSLQKN